MFDRFTDQARKVYQLANQEAQLLCHEYVGSEHLLLALLRVHPNFSVLNTLGLDYATLRKDTLHLLTPGPDVVVMGKLPQTPRAKRVTENAIQAARYMNNPYICVDHVLCGLLMEEDGTAYKVLNANGVTLENVRGVMRRQLQEAGEQSGPLTGMRQCVEDHKSEYSDRDTFVKAVGACFDTAVRAERKRIVAMLREIAGQKGAENDPMTVGTYLQLVENLANKIESR